MIVEVPFSRYKTVVFRFQMELHLFEGFLQDKIWPNFRREAPAEPGIDPSDRDVKLLEDLVTLLSRDVEHMRQGIQKITSTLNDLQEAVAVPNREKRSALIGVGVKILKFLFGTLEEDDLRNLSDAVDQVNLRVDTPIHFAHLQASALDATNANVERDAQAIKKLVEATGNLIEQVKQLHHQLLRDRRSNRRWIQLPSIYSAQLRECCSPHSRKFRMM